jgi:Lon protease-like protein
VAQSWHTSRGGAPSNVAVEFSLGAHTVGQMTLPNTALFPQALLPLHIYEPRYQEMLRDVLASNRLFAVAGLDLKQAVHPGRFEPPYPIAAVGIVRACQKHENGTSNLLLQGLCRVEIVAIATDEPYRKIRIKALASEAGATNEENQALRGELARLIGVKLKLAASGASEMAAFLKTIEDPEIFADIAAFSLCEDVGLRQRLLETLDVHRRLVLLRGRFRSDISELKLRHKLQGRLPDDQIPHN